MSCCIVRDQARSLGFGNISANAAAGMNNQEAANNTPAKSPCTLLKIPKNTTPAADRIRPML
jgi:hypothetical protein